MKKTSDGKIAHLEMIQGVIGRMATDSQTLKTLTITITAAIIAIAQASGRLTLALALAGMFPTCVFWYLSAYYLQVERAYRALYDAVRRDENVEEFSMEWRPFKKSAGNITYLAFRPTIVLIYFSAIALLLFVAFFSGREAEHSQGTELKDGRLQQRQESQLYFHT